MGYPPVVVYALSGSSQAIGPSTNPVKYMGISVRETGSAAAVLRVRVGSATGKILDTISLVDDESVREWYGPSGIESEGQLYVEIVSGTIEGSIRIA